MKQYLYFDNKFKRYFLSSGITEHKDKNFNRIGEVSEIVEAYQNRGKSQYNNATKE